MRRSRHDGHVGRIAPLVIAVVLASCAADAPPGAEASGPTGDDSLASKGLYAACGASRFDAVPPDTTSMPTFAAWTDLDLTNVGGERSYLLEWVAGYDWVVTEETANARSLFGLPRTEGGRDPMYASASLELRDGAWMPVGWGDCRIELEAEGWGNARFTIDPSSPPDAAATSITVLANEMACAGGLAPSDRDVRAVILDDDPDAVSIVILVEPTSGATTCQGNPDFPFEVELPTPLGDREIHDASVSPAETRWPD
jgi:hypothetical protein